MTNQMLKRWSVKYSRQKGSLERLKGQSGSKNEDLRGSKENHSSDDEWIYEKERARIFPKNVTASNFWLFMWIPSLVYEPSFLRRPNRRLALDLLI